MQYHLSLKTVQVDLTTQVLLSFLTETLAPNSLEVLFLQDRRRTATHPPMTADHIFQGPVKKHRLSLRKLLVDSSYKDPTVGGPEGLMWKNWILPLEMLMYLTSRRMPNLKELAAALDHRDWVSWASWLCVEGHY